MFLNCALLSTKNVDVNTARQHDCRYHYRQITFLSDLTISPEILVLELDRDHKKFGFGSSIRIITDLLSDRPVSPGLFTARPGPQKVSFWELLQQELVFVYHRLAGSDIHRKHTILIWQRDTPCTSNNARHRTETSNHESLADCTKRTRSMSFNNAFLAAMVHTVNAFKRDAIFQKGKKTNYRQRNMK